MLAIDDELGVRRKIIDHVGNFLQTNENPKWYANGHSVRVGIKAGCFLAHLGRPEAEQKRAAKGGTCHDGGKAVIVELVESSRKLTFEEKELVRRVHSDMGGRILNSVLKGRYQESELWHMVAAAMLHHHPFAGAPVSDDCWEILFPDQTIRPVLARKDIPLVARVVAVIDAFDSMVVDRRAYRGGALIDHHDAMSLIIDDAGKLYDPELVYEFLCWESGLNIDVFWLFPEYGELQSKVAWSRICNALIGFRRAIRKKRPASK